MKLEPDAEASGSGGESLLKEAKSVLQHASILLSR